MPAVDDGNGFHVEFDAEKFLRFKLAYGRAVVMHQKDFVFEGHVVSMEYAKYVIEYLKTFFP